MTTGNEKARATNPKRSARKRRGDDDELSQDQRELIEQANKAARERVKDALAREQAEKELAALRRQRDGYAVDGLRLLSPEELGSAVEPLTFLIKGIWPQGSFGPFGGAKKSLKTWCAMIHAVAIASGKPSFNYDPWEVEAPSPVLYICGEGGERMVKRRLQRVAEMYDVELADIPLYVVVGVAPFDSDHFKSTLKEHIDSIHEEQAELPALVVLDSLYNYHPSGVEVSNLYGRGGVLSGLQHWVQAVTTGPTTPDGAALWTIDHFNKSGSGLDLDRYGQAGMNAWADSWVNAEVVDADADQGNFTLRVVAGSRQGYHHDYGLNMSLGRFNTDTGEYEDNLKVVVTDGDPAPGKSSKSRPSDNEVDNAIIACLNEVPHALTKQSGVVKIHEEFGQRVGLGRIRMRWGELADQGLIHEDKRQAMENDRKVSRQVWAVGKRTLTGPKGLPGEKRARATRTGNPSSARRKAQS
jgi:hypothetical protein